MDIDNTGQISASISESGARSETGSQTHYHRLIARLPAMVFELDPNGAFLGANQAFTHASGYTLQELQGKKWEHILSPDHESAQAGRLLELVQSQDVSDYEIVLRRKDGVLAAYKLNTANDYREDGRLGRIVAFCIDASSHKQPEEALQVGEDRYRAIVENQTELICRWLPDGTLTFVNQAYCRYFGKTSAELYGSNFLTLVAESDREALIEQIEKISIENPEQVQEHRVILPNGDLHWQQWFNRALFDESGHLIEVQSVGRDITERKLAEEALRESEERYRLVIQSVHDYAIFSLDTEGYVTSWNPGAQEIKGYTADEILGKHLSTFYPAEDRARGKPERVLATAVAQGHYEEEGWRICKDGSRFWANLIIAPIRDSEGRLRGFTKVVRDMSHRKRAEEAIQRQTGFVKLLQEVAVAANQAASIAEVVQLSLDRICAQTGWEIGHAWTKEEDTDRLVSLKVWHLEDPERFASFRQATEETRPGIGLGLPGTVLAIKEPLWFSNITDLPSYQRRDITVESDLRTGLAFPIWSGDTIVGVLEFFSQQSIEPDEALIEVMAHIGTQLGRVVERKRLEAEVAELQRRLMDNQETERVRLARVLHDGPVQDLYGISFNLKAFNDRLPEGVDKRPVEELQATLQQVARTLRRITGELRPPTLAHFGLEKAIRSHAELFKETYPHIDILLELASDGQSLPEMVRLGLYRIYQHALSNVLRHSQASQVLVRLEIERQKVILEVQDNGAGFQVPTSWIDSAREGHLGLAGAAERAQAIGGKLEVASVPGKGTRVRVVIPNVARVKMEV